jgi:hypothetical protein
MSAAAHTDSALSGQASDNIDKQKGPATGSNVESPGGTLGTATAAVPAADSSAKPESGGKNDANAQQQHPAGGAH